MCWECTSHTCRPDGYTYIRRDNKREFLHRYMYRIHNGEILEGNIIRHTCDNPKCINPNHLIAGTTEDNVQDRVNRNRSASGINHGRSKLTEKQVIEIYLNRESKHSELSVLYNVDDTIIRKIQRGLIWKSVTKHLQQIEYISIGHASKLSHEQVAEVFLSALSPNDLSKIYNVHSSTIRKIKNRKLWRSITDSL